MRHKFTKTISLVLSVFAGLEGPIWVSGSDGSLLNGQDDKAIE